ncbi:MAG: hypothetical protein DBX61_11960 [Clostridiales bacterium]|nr:MAG: hypothetical protein DBX61_11960 [Clostridiales bacterium]
MQIIKRKMSATKDTTEECGRVQASFNSDGRITLRMTNGTGEDDDMIVVFSQEETIAIVTLFKEIKCTLRVQDLPF